MVKLDVPTIDGVPVTLMDAAVLLDSVKPGGKVPVVIAQVNGPVDPVTEITPL
jgi:hypothetical protein